MTEKRDLVVEIEKSVHVLMQISRDADCANRARSHSKEGRHCESIDLLDESLTIARFKPTLRANRGRETESHQAWQPFSGSARDLLVATHLTLTPEVSI